jgi:glycerophosphodiester phosphodiesterase
MGANVWHPTSTTPIPAPFRENTLKSFQRAVACGASFLEFDVQVTKDGVPVIWHDNYVVYGDEAAPTSRLIADLTAEEFRRLAPINDLIAEAAASGAPGVLEGGSPLGGSPMGGSPLGGSPMGGSPLGGSPSASAWSLASLESSATASTASSGRARLLRKHKNGEPAVACEPTLRSWLCQEEDHFPTLAEVFATIPPDVAFDIEVKMATPDDLAVTPTEEVDRMVSTTLAAVDAGLAAHGPRLVMFSSFDPEICVEIKRRWPDAPVMFLSGGGVYAHADPRRTSVAAAIDFAAGAGLQGVILNTLALQAEAQMVQAALARGLRVMTYGLPNDDPEWVRAQQRMGVQGVIVDDVAGVAAALSASA